MHVLGKWVLMRLTCGIWILLIARTKGGRPDLNVGAHNTVVLADPKRRTDTRNRRVIPDEGG